ncbi:MAG: hypothetical protein CR981_00450 [Proteobacteria bacterium]|nr:MAG: hypothetical protein CR981_00450 [Pseudomonadota bacterium]PIE64714.1 MAG: hypothetical protein CSA26_06645 [Desulfobacterales bacterium]
MGKISKALKRAGYDEGSIPDGNEEEQKTRADTASDNRQGPSKAPESDPKQRPMTDMAAIPEADGESTGTNEGATFQAVSTSTSNHRTIFHSGSWDERLHRAINIDHYIPEVFKIIRSRILHPKDDRKPPRTIMVTSAIPKEGKTFVTANLGISLAQGMEQYSLLVNGDLRCPSLAAMFGLDSSKGLVDYLRDYKLLPDLIQKTSVSKLSVLASGRPPLNPAELLGSSRMRDLIQELSSRYDDRIIIFDSPPGQVVSETSVLSNMVDGIIVVVKEGGAGRMQVRRLIEDLGAEKIIGIVFNNHTPNIIERYLIHGYHSKYGYD